MASKDILMGVELTGGATATVPVEVSEVNDFDVDISRGATASYSQWHAEGLAAGVGATERVLDLDAAWTWSVGSGTIRIAPGGNANDTSAGTGARTVFVQGVGGSGGAWAPQSETVVLNGASAVNLTGSYARVNRAEVVTTGTFQSTGPNGNSPVGNILINDPLFLQRIIQINAGLGRTFNATFTTHSSQTAYITRWRGQSATTTVFGSTIFKLNVRNNADENGLAAPFTSQRVVDSLVVPDSGHVRIFDPPIKVAPRSDIWISVVRDATGIATCAGSFDLILEE